MSPSLYYDFACLLSRCLGVTHAPRSAALVDLQTLIDVSVTTTTLQACLLDSLPCLAQVTLSQLRLRQLRRTYAVHAPRSAVLVVLLTVIGVIVLSLSRLRTPA